MITKYKIYENIYNRNLPPEQFSGMQVGDFAVATNADFGDVANVTKDDVEYVEKYFESHIGEIVKIAPIMMKFVIDDEYLLDILKQQFTVKNNVVKVEFRAAEITIWSNNKEELEIELQANKYNL